MNPVDPTSEPLVIGDRRPIVVPSPDHPSLSWVILRCTGPGRCGAPVSFHSRDTEGPDLGAPSWVYESGWRLTDPGWLCPAHPDPSNLEQERQDDAG